MTIINVADLHKHFKVNKHRRGLTGAVRALFSSESTLVRAVDGISFSVEPGELVGYLGPNGAGKSTTLKMLTGLLVPTSGEVHANGHVPWRDRKTYVARIGAVFGQRSTLWWDLPVIESLELLQYIYKIPGERFRHNLDECRALLELDPFIHTPVRSLSLGTATCSACSSGSYCCRRSGSVRPVRCCTAWPSTRAATGRSRAVPSTRR